MLERLTSRAKLVLAMANQAASEFNHTHIGTDDVLLALLREGSGVAAAALQRLGVDQTRVLEARPQVLASAPEPSHLALQGMLRHAFDEAAELSHSYVGTEHLLLGILRQDDSAAARILAGLGLPAVRVRNAVLEMLEEATPPEEPPAAVDATGLPVEVATLFTGHAREALALAQKEACRLQHDWISTEHLLLGLIGAQAGSAAGILRDRSVTLEAARAMAETLVPIGPRESPPGPLPYTHGARKVFQHALEEARARGAAKLTIGTEHLLLGLLRETPSIAQRVLRSLGLPVETLCEEVRALLAGRKAPESGSAPVEPACSRVEPANTPIEAAPGPELEQLLVHARQIARQLRAEAVEPGHLLLAMLKQRDGIAARVLARLNVSIEQARLAAAREMKLE